MAGSRKCWLACRLAITRPLIEKMMVAIRFRRINSAISWRCSRPNPGAMPPSASMICWAKIAMNTAATAVTTKARLATRENRSQAAARPFSVRYSLINGMNAIANAPPEIRAKSTSGRLLAALKVSNSPIESRYWREMMPVRTKASTLSSPKKNPISRDVRARKEIFFIS